MYDGGYYAIKGFSFQIDKTIKEILSMIDISERVYIENIQDINTTDNVIQVKYKETQTYTPSKIKEPTLQLIEEFKKNNTPNYVLYCFFSDKAAENSTITIEQLNAILAPINGTSEKSISINKRINNITEAEKKDFLNKFKIVFATEYDSHFDAVISSINNTFNDSSKNQEPSLIYYSLIANYLKNIVINEISPANRFCTKEMLLTDIKSKKKIIFDSSLSDFLDSQKHFKYLKYFFIEPQKNQQNIIIIENAIETEMSIGNLISKIISRQFTNPRIDIEPWIFVLSNENILSAKKELINLSIRFNDGYEEISFSEREFLEQSIKLRKTKKDRATESLDKISFKAKIISVDNFEKVKNQIKASSAYLFGSSIELENKCLFKANNIDTLLINKLFNT